MSHFRILFFVALFLGVIPASMQSASRYRSSPGSLPLLAGGASELLDVFSHQSQWTMDKTELKIKSGEHQLREERGIDEDHAYMKNSELSNKIRRRLVRSKSEDIMPTSAAILNDRERNITCKHVMDRLVENMSPDEKLRSMRNCTWDHPANSSRSNTSCRYLLDEMLGQFGLGEFSGFMRNCTFNISGPGEFREDVFCSSNASSSLISKYTSTLRSKYCSGNSTMVLPNYVEEVICLPNITQSFTSEYISDFQSIFCAENQSLVQKNFDLIFPGNQLFNQSDSESNITCNYIMERLLENISLEEIAGFMNNCTWDFSTESSRSNATCDNILEMLGEFSLEFPGFMRNCPFNVSGPGEFRKNVICSSNTSNSRISEHISTLRSIYCSGNSTMVLPNYVKEVICLPNITQPFTLEYISDLRSRFCAENQSLTPTSLDFTFPGNQSLELLLDDMLSSLLKKLNESMGITENMTSHDIKNMTAFVKEILDDLFSSLQENLRRQLSQIINTTGIAADNITLPSIQSGRFLNVDQIIEETTTVGTPSKSQDADDGEVTTKYQAIDEVAFDPNCLVVSDIEVGNFMTPNFPEDYSPNSKSCWIFVSDPSEVILITFDEFQLDSTQTEPCDITYSHVNITDLSSYRTVICGQEAKRTFTSYTGHMKVSFDARLGKGRGFDGTFRMFRDHAGPLDGLPCNSTKELENRLAAGQVTTPVLMSRCQDLLGRWQDWNVDTHKSKEWLASPSYPDPNPTTSHCVWVIRGEEGQTFDMQFQSFYLGEVSDPYPSCANANATLLITDCVSGVNQPLCGNEGYILPEEITVPSHSIEIKFDSYVTGVKGFHGYYELKPVSPSPSTLAASLSTMNNVNTVPTTVLPSVNNRTQVGMDNATCDSFRREDCGRIILAESGRLIFERNKGDIFGDCLLNIRSQVGTVMALQLVIIDLGVSSRGGMCNMSSSYLQVSFTGKTHTVCDSSEPNVFISDSNEIEVFVISVKGARNRFCATFTAVNSTLIGNISNVSFPCACKDVFIDYKNNMTTPSPKLDPSSCQFFITTGSGTFPPPNFPSPYLPDMECVWTLLAEKGQTINLEFTSFDLDASRRRRRCLLTDTHVQVTIINDVDAVLQRRFCSDTNISGTIPPARSIAVKFKSAARLRGIHRGFSMAYAFVSDTSTNYTNNVTSNSSADASMDVGDGFRILLDESSLQPTDEIPIEDLRTKSPTLVNDRTRLIIPIENEIGNFTHSSSISTLVTIETMDMTSNVSNSSATSGESRVSTSPDNLVTIRHVERTTTGRVTELSSKSAKTATVEIYEEFIPTTTPGGILEKNTISPGRGRMTARQMELTIYICTAVAALLIIVLIIVTLYCAKNKKRKDKSGFDVDVANEANYWQTYKDWAKDWRSEPGGSVRSTVGAMCGDDTASAAKHPDPVVTDDSAAVADNPSSNLKTVSAVVNQPPVEKPSRNFTVSEKLI